MGFFEADKIAGDTCLIVPDAGYYHFGILESKMHMIWVSYTCGRLESRFRYSKDIVYNNFPWPEFEEIVLTNEIKYKVEECVKNIFRIRLLYPQSSLSDLYNPNTMPLELVKAHDDLDRAVDACYGRKFANKEERIEFLFELYKQYMQ